MATRWGICSAGRISNDFVVALQTLPALDHQNLGLRSRDWIKVGHVPMSWCSDFVNYVLYGRRSGSVAVAVAARDLTRAKEFAQNHNIPQAYGTYEELAKDPNVDIVYVGAIHPAHRDLVLLFFNHGKNVLCEKPMAMNLTEVKELISAARKHNVFLMEAFWSRFFPVYEEIRSLLHQKVIGEVNVVRAEFGVNLLAVARSVEKELGGGAILDIGCYCIQFASMAFNGEKPESITAKGFLHDTGVDETVTVILQYSGKRQAVLTCTMVSEMPNQAIISGTKGLIQIPSFMWSPTSLIVNGKEAKFTLPPTTKHLNFYNSTGLSYEAEHVRQCLLKGLKESPIMSLAESELLAGIIEEIHTQLGICKND